MSDEEEQPDDGEDGSNDEKGESFVQPEYDPDSLDSDIFSGIYAHNGAKAVTAAALRNGDIHVLYEGPPGSGKSAFLLSLESNVPGVIYRDGKQITGASLRDTFKGDPPILLIDEIDALDSKAYDVLSTPMEHGRLVRDSARESYDVEVGTQVIAACNDASVLPEHIASRFRKLEFEKYDETEYVDLCAKMLPTEVDWISNENEAREAAKKVMEITGKPDPRDARDVSQMARSLDEIDTLATAMHDPDAEMDHQALYPGEVARAKGEVGKVHLRRTLAEEAMQETEEAGGEGDESSDEDEAAQDAIEDEIEAAVEDAVSEAD